MTPFVYHRPTQLADALALLRDDNARPIAGGMTLIPTLKQGLAQPAALVDLAGIDALYGIRLADGVIEIGAMTRHYDVATSPLVIAHLPGLADLAGQIGDLQVRNRGTIGGSVANNDPAADYPAAVLALCADVVTDRRSISADAFFTGMFETALEPGEIVTAVRFPAPRRCAYAKFANPVSGYALAGVFVGVHAEGMRVAVTGAGPCVFRASAIEAALARDPAAASFDAALLGPDGLVSDLHASAAYRAQLARVLAARAVARLP